MHCLQRKLGIGESIIYYSVSWNVKCIWNVQGVSELYRVYLKCTVCIWNVQSVTEIYRVYLKCTECIWNLQSVSEIYGMYLKHTECIWNVQSVCEMYRVYLKCTGCIWNIQRVSEILDHISTVRRFDSWSECKPKWSLSHFLHEDGWISTILTAWRWNYF